MPKTIKTLQPKNLLKYDVYIEDTAPNSDYFDISQLSQVFTGGRNSFLVGGSTVLQNNTVILIEILDANGLPIYQNPVKSYIEADSRMVTVEINENTPSGPATIIVMGSAVRQIDGTEIPDNWRDKYNVRWRKTIRIESKLKNKSQIKFVKNPQVFSEEKRFFNVATSSFTTLNSPITASLSPIMSSGYIAGYLISAIAPTTFSGDHYGAIITGSMLIDDVSASLQLPITNIVNSTTAFSEGYRIKTTDGRVVDKIYLISGSYTSSVFNNDAVIKTTATLLYNDLNIINTNIPISYAKLRIINLNTVSGEIFKTKIYSKVATNLSDYKLVANSDVVTTELLVTSSIRGDLPIGDFYTVPTASNNWYADRVETSSNVIYTISGSSAYYNPSASVTPFSVYVDQNTLLNSIYASVPTTYNTPISIVGNATESKFSGQISESGYFIGTKLPVTLFSSTEYTLQLNAYYKQFSGSVNLTGNAPKVDIYMVGVSGSIIENNPLGQKIGTLSVNSNATSQRFENKQFNFNPNLVDGGLVGLRFIITNGFWNFSNISLKPASDSAFSPDEVTLLIPNTEYFNQYLSHKIEFFDINNNSTEVTAISLPAYFTGSAIDLGVIS